MVRFRLSIHPDAWDEMIEWCEQSLKSIPMWRYIRPWHHTDNQNLYDLYFWDDEDLSWFVLGQRIEQHYDLVRT